MRRAPILPLVHPGRALSVRLNSYQGQAEATEETATQMPHHKAEDNTITMLKAAAGLSGTMVSSCSWLDRDIGSRRR
jgi:hypothetical protein